MQKEFLPYDSDSVNEMLHKMNNNLYPYETDGIIFTPHDGVLSKDTKDEDKRDKEDEARNKDSFWNTGVKLGQITKVETT